MRELKSFCREEPDFRPVLELVSPEASISTLTDVLVEYCEKRVLLAELLAAVEEHNPRQYERYRDKVVSR